MPHKLYHTFCGRCLLKVLTLPAVSKTAGFFLSTPLSKVYIKKFIKKNKIDMNDFEPKKYPETMVFYRPETGTTYVAYYHGSTSVTDYEKMLSYVKKVYGGDWFVANDLDEYDWIYNELHRTDVYCGIRKSENGLVWADGSPLQPEFKIGEIINNSPDDGWCFFGSI